MAVVALTLTLNLFLLLEMRWHGRLLEEIKETLLKRYGKAHPELAPSSARAQVDIETTMVADSKDEWDQRFAERADDRMTPTLPSGPSRTPRGS